MRINRLWLPAFIGLLVMSVAVMGRVLWVDLETLSTAGNENAQWTILQLDTEFANLQLSLLEQDERPEIDRDAIRLRTDITLSRVNLASQGVAADIIQSDETARAHLDEIQHYADEAVVLIDGELSRNEVARLTELTVATAPIARQLALRGIQLGAERTEARRKEFAKVLRNTGLVAISVIGALAAVLVFLDRLLWNAREKDKELRASSGRLEAMVSGSLDAIVTSNGTGKILDINPAAERIFGWQRMDLAGLNIKILLSDLTPDAEERKTTETHHPFSKFLNKGRVEIVARRRNGEVYPADLTVTSVSGNSDDLVIIYLRDISDQKLGEQALVDAKERAEQTDRAKSNFLTVMSHEMRTPLNGVLGVLELLRTTKLSQRQLQHVSVAAASSEVLMGQLNEALDITRIETGSLILAPQRFNLAAEVGRVATVLEPLAREKGIDLYLHVDPEMRMDFWADGNRIAQIVTNLIGNAIKFTTSGSIEITVAGTHAPSRTSAEIVVRDTGVGIPEKHIEAIFENYVALSNSSGRMSRSDGLGLSISRKTARLMSGDIKVSSTEDRGSVFTLTLPLERIADTDQSFLRQSVTNPEESKLPSKIHALIVEDNSINRAVLHDMIQDMGHVASVAVDGLEGYKMAKEQPFDLIFMDINMPEMDGIELTKKIRETNGPNRSTRIQGLTAYGWEEFHDLAKAAGMDGFSTKPLRLQELSNILGGKQADSSAVPIQSGDLDTVVIEELRGALGEASFKEKSEEFFCETERVLADLRRLALPADREALSAHLHKLGGAAALFGLRKLTNAVASARLEAVADSTEAFLPILRNIENVSEEARWRFREHNSAAEHGRAW